jgi:hypothetical protein
VQLRSSLLWARAAIAIARRMGTTARLASAALALMVGGLATACFGDNSEEPNPGAPTVQEIVSPEGLDLGASTSVVIKVKGRPAQQLSVAVDATLGSFTMQSKVVITDDAGEASWTTNYTAGNAAGAELLSVNVSDLTAMSSSATKELTIYGAERVGRVDPVGLPAMQTAGVLVGYPVVITGTRTVIKLGVVSPPQSVASTVNAQVGLYSKLTDTSLSALAKTTATLVDGVNELPIAPLELADGTYWMVVAYSGTPLVYRSTTELVSMYYKTTHVFSDGIGDTIEGLSKSAVTAGDGGQSLYARNFFVVLRK